MTPAVGFVNLSDSRRSFFFNERKLHINSLPKIKKIRTLFHCVNSFIGNGESSKDTQNINEVISEVIIARLSIFYFKSLFYI